MRKTEQVLSALFARLQTLVGIPPDGTVVLRQADKSEAIPAGGLLILRDGSPGEPVETYMSPTTYIYEHVATIEAFARGATQPERAAALDALIVPIAALFDADRTLGGLCDDVREQAPEPDDVELEGAPTEAFAAVPIVLTYGTTSPLV